MSARHHRKALRTDSVRRRLLKALGAAGLSGMGLPLGACAGAEAAPVAALPSRKLGRADVQVPILGLGIAWDVESRLILLNQALRRGVTLWETAPTYAGGHSEEGIGQYFKRFPRDRDRVFLITKGVARRPDELTRQLTGSLRRMGTDRVEGYLLHAVFEEAELSDAVGRWAMEQKRLGRVRYVGLSTHKNMAAVLHAAARRPWVDLVMTAFNYRLQRDAEVSAAVDACVAAGVAILAMKTRGLGHGDEGDPAHTPPTAPAPPGQSFDQLRTRAIFSDPRVTCVVRAMMTVQDLEGTIRTAVDPAPLEAHDLRALEAYARATRARYCSGCATRCEAAAGGPVPVADILRLLTYARAYRDPERARAAFRALPASTRARLRRGRFEACDAACPHGVPISALMRDAAARLA
jgi:uncharacterized protein